MFARITLDTSDYESGLDGASKNTSNFADKLKTGLATAAKVGAAALTAAATGVAALTKASIDQYAEYEQLVGGVETLFGQASDTVMQYAQNAFQTAGMSANEYMETVTSFSASLLQGLGGDTAAAAEIANQALTDMSDNANKMGTDISMIQNAYQGFAKQNYTMLDNLKLGYGGTQAEMARLINDSGVLGDTFVATAENVNEVSFDKIIEAIHVVQTNMGITGTTAAEAASTIQGSISMMSAAWRNFLTGMADPEQDFDTLLGNLVDSVVTVGENLVPRIQALLPRLADGLTQLVQGLLPYIPTTLQTLLPTLITGATSLINGFSAVLPAIITTAVDSIPQLASAAVSIVSNLVSALIEAAPQILSAGTQLLDQLVNGIINGLPGMIARIPVVIDEFLTYLSDNMPKILEQGVAMINSLVNGIIAAIPDLVSKLPEIINSIVEFISENLPQIISAGYDILINLITGIIDAIPDLVESLPQIIDAIITGIENLMGGIVDVGKAIVEGIWDGIAGAADWLVGKVTGFFDDIVGGVKDFLGIASPSKLFRDEIGRNIGLGVAAGLEDSEDEAVKAASNLAEAVYDKSVEWLDRQSKYQNFSLQEQLEVWEAIKSQFIEGSEQYADAEEEIFDLRQKIREEEIAAEESFRSKIEEISQNIVDIENSYQEALSSRAKEIFNSYSLFDSIPERQEVAGESLISNLQSQISTMEEFYSGLDELTQRGVGDSLVQEIREMGPGAVDQLSALLALSDGKLSEYADLYQEKQDLANSVAMEELKGLREETTSEIESQLEAITDLYNQQSPEVGLAFSNGLANGIRSGMSLVSSAAEAVARAAEDAVRSVTDTHSPSRVFEKIGEYMAQGLALGWDNEMDSVRRGISNSMNFGTANVDFASSGLGVASAGMVNGFSAAVQSNQGGQYTFNLLLPDGTKLASYTFRPMVDYAKANGTPILNPT